ncbi:MAG: hypothetical protein R3A47_12000 [Polyangiales bacterium]
MKTRAVVLALTFFVCVGCTDLRSRRSAVDAASQNDQAWWWNTHYTETRYLIALLHGFMVFDSLLGGIVDYWPGIVSH